MQNKRVELLAPAGNTEGFYGAIHAGADAVYLGGNRFGARAYADNFTTEELVSCIRYAHLWGRKVYLTVNTLVKENEFQEIYDYLLPYYEAGLDGVIVQDIGVFAYIREHFPNIELHVSTQMTLTGVYGTKLLQDMGACRIVPARELSLEEIRHIKEQTGIAIEAFIHGAMCYCYSGQCLFSSILGGRSGNRGRCAQPCRLPYQVESSKGKTAECYPMSLKDMCTIENIPELIEAGIDSFKIEGRMKKPEYAAGVTAIYRKYIDRVYEQQNQNADSKKSAEHKNNINSRNNTGRIKIDAEDMRKLSHLYIRSEIQNGYYHKHNGKDMVTLSSPAYSGSDDALLAQIRQQYLEQRPKRNIDIYADFTTGQQAALTVLCGDLSVTVSGNVVEQASKQPVTKENIAKQLGKLGDSIFTADTMEITVSEDAFYPLRAINELRREAIARLEDALIEENGFPLRREDAVSDLPVDRNDAMPEATELQIAKNKATDKPEDHTGRMFLSVRREEQLRAVYHLICKKSSRSNAVQGVANSHATHSQTTQIRRIYLNCELFDGYSENVMNMCRELSTYCELVISLPYVIRERDYGFLEKVIFPLFSQGVFNGVQIRSLEGMGMVKDILRKNTEYPVKLYTDTGFYIWNKATLSEWTKSENTKPTEFSLPLELKGVEQKSLLGGEIPCEKVIYGRAPMMLTANCVANTTSDCRKGSDEHVVRLIDRYHKSFPVELNCRQCLNIIYNSVPLSLHGELEKWKMQADLRLDFTVENERETVAVLDYFVNKTLLNPPYEEYTTGHEKRGVE